MKFVLLELALAGLVLVGLFPILDVVPSGWLAPTGVLGILSGIGLSVMLLPAANVWFDADDDTSANPARPTRVQERIRENSPKIAAAISMILILFVYVPFSTERLAQLEAQVDLEKGNLPVAVLTTEDDPVDPLPEAIASGADGTKSTLVRVVLAQSQNTYVLDSPQCTTISEAIITHEDGETFATDPDLCRVFAIPTARLTSIEYVSTTGTPPANSNLSQATFIEEDEPLDEAVRTVGASDEELVQCELGDGEVSFHKAVWYEFAPSRQGSLLVRAVTGDQELVPTVGVWELLGEQLSDEAAAGSGDNGRACNAATLPESVTRTEESSATSTNPHQKVASATADVEADRTYVIAVGSQTDRGGNLDVHIEFFPNAETATVEQPNVQIVFYIIDAEPRVRVQAALLAAMDTNEVAIRLGLKSPPNIVEASYEARAALFVQAGLTPGEILRPVAMADELNVLIVMPGEATNEELTILLGAASVMQIQMLDSDLGVNNVRVGFGEEAIDQCAEPCASVLMFLGSSSEGEPTS